MWRSKLLLLYQPKFLNTWDEENIFMTGTNYFEPYFHKRCLHKFLDMPYIRSIHHALSLHLLNSTKNKYIKIWLMVNLLHLSEQSLKWRRRRRLSTWCTCTLLWAEWCFWWSSVWWWSSSKSDSVIVSLIPPSTPSVRKSSYSGSRWVSYTLYQNI